MNRDYLAEAAALPIHRFDKIMHGYLWRTFQPYMRDVSALELGCFRGAFTRRIRAEYPDVAVVDASADCIAAARAIGQQIECVHATFEQAELERCFDAIFAVHVLEHLDDPVRVLTRCGAEWLNDDGRVFVAVPNAQAASRQLAVKMGLIDKVEAVTASEAEHGHKRTYTRDLLWTHLVAAGLQVEDMGGVMFKPLANFQWDRALAEGIVDAAYLEACYAMGKELPDLCSSLYAVCRRRR